VASKDRTDSARFCRFCTGCGAKNGNSRKKESVTTDSESDIYKETEPSAEASSGWLKFALLTAATALAGGVATAWFYRKTLEKLRETGENPQNSHFGISAAQRPDDEADDF
jgi:hypothetical protein